MDNIMDPEVSSEMIKLFMQELKVVRAQLLEAEMRTSATPCTGGPSSGPTHETAQTLIAENSSLKADNAALQEMIARLTQLMSHMGEEIAKLLAENEDLIREKEEASRNQERLREKYKHSKVKLHEHSEILNELHVALSNCTQELEQTKRAAAEIDFRDFLRNLPYEPVEGQLSLSSIKPYAHGARGLYKDVMDVCKGPYFIKNKEVIWSPSGIALGLVIKPTFQYNPRSYSGTWTKLKDDFDVGKQMDVCYLSGQTSRYPGTYERVGDQGTMIIASQTLKHLDHEILDYVSKRTILFPDLLPPSQATMIKNMYNQGVIKLQCFGIRCTAFNQTFAKKLQNNHTYSVQRNLPDNATIPTSAVTRGDVWKQRKRKRDPGSTANSTNHKKRYGPSTMT